MTSKKLYFLGSHFLLLHVANSFILLTANMEDVKKIAQRFVSDSLANKIAEFVAKATEQMVTNVSAENEQNADDIQYLSREHDSLKHIVRQGGENDGREEITTIVTETSKIDYNKEFTTEKYKAQSIDWEKEVNEIGLNNIKEEKANEQKDREYDQKVDFDRKDTDHKDYEQVDNGKKEEVDYEKVDYDKKAEYDQQKADYEQAKAEDKAKIEEDKKIAYEEQNRIYKQQLDSEKIQKPDTKHKMLNKNYNRPKLHKRPKHGTKTTRQIVDSTILYQQVLRKLIDRGNRLASMNSKELKSPIGGLNRGYKLSSMNSKELKSPKGGFRGHRLASMNSKESKSPIGGFNIQRALTTAKERKEFDQYDIPNYPKSEFIATSGPVALPKVSMVRPWWEKKMTMPE